MTGGDISDARLCLYMPAGKMKLTILTLILCCILIAVLFVNSVLGEHIASGRKMYAE